MNLLFNFNGRIGRGAYWLGILAVFVFSSALIAAFFAYFISIGGFEELEKMQQELAKLEQDNPQVMQQQLQHIVEQTQFQQLQGLAIFINLATLPLLYMTLAIDAKRLHDMGYTGWLCVLGLIPLVNIIMLFWLGFVKGQEGPNEYGPDPHAA
ncbi:MAG: DUF805 domain-containing protein [Alphaproteobacteria bacterium]